jgi:hypothetical protein
LGPAIYGFVFMKTAATFPRAIFFVTVATLTVAILLISFIRLPPVAPTTAPDAEATSTRRRSVSTLVNEQGTLVDEQGSTSASSHTGKVGQDLASTPDDAL